MITKCIIISSLLVLVAATSSTAEVLFTLVSPSEEVDGGFGYNVSGAGDVNMDGYDDVVVGAHYEAPGSSPNYAGRAYVFDGQTGTPFHTLVSSNEEEEYGGPFGYSVSGAGDANGDGYDDVVVGAYSDDPGSSPPGAGRAYTLSWMHLSAELTGNDLALQWSTWSPASEYWVYGMGNEPWFAPDTLPPTYVNRVAVVPAETTTWSSSAGVGDPEENWTYLVIGVADTNQEIARSTRAGEHDFQTDIP